MINSFIYQFFIYFLFTTFFIFKFYRPINLKAQKDDKKTIFAWSLYDFANQPFTTLVVTFIYGAFFTKIIVADEILGTSLWSRAITISSLIVAFLSPIMGAIADNGGYRKFFFISWTWICIIFTYLLFIPKSGDILIALTFFIIANIGFEMGGVFCNSYLYDIASSKKIGRISGYGWSFGYVGGLIALIISFFLLIDTPTPIFGLSTESGENIRATNILISVWFAIFSIPAFLFLKDVKISKKFNVDIINDSFSSIKKTFTEIKKYKNILRFLTARLFYNDGLITIFAFGGIYASTTFNFSFNEIFLFGILLNFCAGIGAFLLGFVDDYIGGKKTIQISNIGLIIACVLATIVPNDSINFYGFSTHGKNLFWFSGVLIGLFSGPNQSASRSLMARLIPKGKENEFFGFFAFSGKATAFIGPFFLGLFTQFFNSQRAGIIIVIILFSIGLLLLKKVSEDKDIV